MSTSRNPLVGTWQLVSFEVQQSDGEVSYPFGQDATGVITYGENGYMSVHLMRRDRPIFSSGDMGKGTTAEIRTAFEGFIGYFGTYQVNEREQTVTHQLNGSLFPNWVGTDQQRFYRLSDNQLTLSTPPTPYSGVEVTGVLVWKRVE